MCRGCVWHRVVRLFCRCNTHAECCSTCCATFGNAMVASLHPPSASVGASDRAARFSAPVNGFEPIAPFCSSETISTCLLLAVRRMRQLICGSASCGHAWGRCCKRLAQPNRQLEATGRGSMCRRRSGADGVTGWKARSERASCPKRSPGRGVDLQVAVPAGRAPLPCINCQPAGRPERRALQRAHMRRGNATTFLYGPMSSRCSSNACRRRPTTRKVSQAEGETTQNRQ